MRNPSRAILLAWGIPLLVSCNDSASTPTGPLNASQSGKKDWVRGEGVIVHTYPFSVSAHGDPAGDKAKGHIESTFFPPPGRFKVGCVAVDGNRGVVGGVNTGPGTPFNDVFLIVEDNGPPGSSVPDRGFEAYGGTADEEGCSRWLRFVGFPLDEAYAMDGDVEVIDGTP